MRKLTFGGANSLDNYLARPLENGCVLVTDRVLN